MLDGVNPYALRFLLTCDDGEVLVDVTIDARDCLQDGQVERLASAHADLANMAAAHGSPTVLTVIDLETDAVVAMIRNEP